ncbi:MAG TPA: type II secretion system F family protein [Dehalococcoidia bacterium]|nr:type II secretion system F family protein [Dehalococcoidia bacterium]
MAGFAAIAVFVAVTALVLGLSSRRKELQQVVDRRLGRASGVEVVATDEVQGVALRGSSRFGKSSAARALSGVRSMQQLGDLIERAGWKLRVPEFLAISGSAGVVFFFVGEFLLRPIAIVLGLVGLVVPYVLLRFAVKRRKDQFVKQLVDGLTMMANALKAGVGLMQAIDQVATALKPPISEEFRHLLRDVRIGASPDDAFDALNQRMKSEDLDIVITGILVQRTTGGNLAEMLENVSHVMRERIRIKGEIKTLTVQQQFSGYLVGGLPLLLLFGFNIMNHQYLAPMFSTTLGRMLLAAGGTLQAIGFFMIRRIVNIKV